MEPRANNGMFSITKVTIYPFEPGEDFGEQSRLLAFADVEIDAALVIKGFRLFKTKGGGLFVGFPSQQTKRGEWVNTVYGLNKGVNEIFRKAIIRAFKNYCDD